MPPKLLGKNGGQQLFHVHGHLVVVVAAGRRRTALKHLEAAGRRAEAPGGQVHVGWSGGVRGTSSAAGILLYRLALCTVALAGRCAPWGPRRGWA